jgi:hypothetical protein
MEAAPHLVYGYVAEAPAVPVVVAPRVLFIKADSPKRYTGKKKERGHPRLVVQF